MAVSTRAVSNRYTKPSRKCVYRVHVATEWKVSPGCVLVFHRNSTSACKRCQQQQAHGHDAACHLVSSETLWPIILYRTAAC